MCPLKKIIHSKSSTYVLSKVFLDSKKFVFVNIYALNDQMQQLLFLTDLSNSVLNSYANETLVVGDELNCALTELDKWWGLLIEHKEISIEEINNLVIAHDLIYTGEQTFPVYKVSLGATCWRKTRSMGPWFLEIQ